MLRVRNATNADDFAGDRSVSQIIDLWNSGASRPDWCFIIEDGARRLGRLGFRVSPTTSDPAWLGSLPPQEVSVFGLDLDWDGGFLRVGQTLFAEAAAAVAGSVPELVEVRILEGVHDRPVARVRLADGLGMGLFSEKVGYQWLDNGERLSTSGRLTFRSVDEIGIDAYREIMAPCGEGTLDRNDRYYWEGCGPQNWAAQMTEYLEPEDARMWLVGYAAGSPVGYVAVARDEDLVSTVAHIGVLPERRGAGFVDDLLAAGTKAARGEGFASMLSDVDVLNHPMAAAMVRGGHLPDRRPWHVWVYRAKLAALVSLLQNRPKSGPSH